MAFGWGWSEKKLWKSEVSYLFKSWKGRRNESDRIERQEWERLRILGSWILAPHAKNITPKKLFPLPWDEVVTAEMWKERNKEILEQCDKIINGAK